MPKPADLGPLTSAAAEVFAVFADLGRTGCLIGGMALQRWGQPRFTADIDLTLLAPLGSEGQLIDELLGRLNARRPDARRQALDFRVLLLVASNGVSVDISLGALPFEEEVIQRASRWRQVAGVWLTTCSAEDLVIYKLVAARPQDLLDVTGVVQRQGRRLDIERIRRWCRLFADLKEDPDLLRPFEDAWRRAGFKD
ncbi:MAG: nucleotidyl transferase AbiEii/AbiGii toxin family protein [Vicinamibacterales bacterium]